MVRSKPALKLASLLCLLGACSAANDPNTPLTSGAPGGNPAGAVDAGASNIAPQRDATLPPLPPTPTINDAGVQLCERRDVDAYGNTPEMLIVLDRSLSMTLFGRWAPSVSAVKSITADFQRLISFGLSLFPATGADACGAGNLDVPTAPLNAPPIAALLDGTGPAGLTPTGAALDFAATTLGDRTVQLDQLRGRPAFVLLVTDGEPSCMGVPGVEDTAQRQAALDAVRRLKSLNIPTYVFGYQIDPAFQALMNQLASEGGTDHYYPAENAADITNAFRTITKDVVSCTFELNEDADPSRVDVRLDGQPVVFDPGAGWTISGRTITLVGQSCDALKDGTGRALSVEVACEPLR